MVGTSQVSARKALLLCQACLTVVLAWTVLLGVGTSDVHAQAKVQVQSAHLLSNTTSLSLGLKYDEPLGADQNQLPSRGEQNTETVRKWLFTGMVGAGAAIPNSGVANTEPTVVGYAGLMKRSDWWFADRIGLAMYVNLEPQAVGPAIILRNETEVEIMIGGLRVEGGDIVLAIGLNLPLVLITDLFK